MKASVIFSGTLVAFIILFNVAVLLNGCSKANDTSTTSSPPTTIPINTVIPIDLIGLRVDSGFCYKLGHDLDVMGDSPQFPTISTMHLYENGVELGPAHAVHHDIRAYGLGQFSHWENGLYFSTSDNSNPLTNGRKYTFIIK